MGEIGKLSLVASIGQDWGEVGLVAVAIALTSSCPVDPVANRYQSVHFHDFVGHRVAHIACCFWGESDLLVPLCSLVCLGGGFLF